MIKLDLPKLPYSLDALEPFMSSETLELHHGKHHLAYVTNGNKFIEEQKIEESDLNKIVINSYQNKNAPIFNNVSQHINHIHFWEIMSNNPNGKIPSELEKKIIDDFGSIDQMKSDFINAGLGQFGSGWCWLVLNNGKLEITKTANAENPIVHNLIPLLGCDVWEHSYYVDYKNRRPDYLKSFVDNLVNWEKVADELNKNI
ncbi:MAG: Superoxide dismutase [Mn] [Alphaproteobacteria bacterium MarineAlpha5_Bin9]|nr:MAG: Superoxide dismutase [Mn] [Alphaproteobacteria bacterium MarineAlpha5_Bin9]|tara:strand:+ start:2669 stop:3271 length:603 start_codon:yes stop_codon:yes gene_type:complete